jgi:uncharacterized protein (DUF1697 family)
MPVIISLLRGINVGGHKKISMQSLRAIYESLGLRDVQTYVQSGNVVFRTDERDVARLASKLEDAIERSFGFRPAVVLRTAADLRAIVKKNPFAGRRDTEPGKLLVTFLAREPGAAARKQILAIEADPEEVHAEGRELYIYFPNGAGRSRFPWVRVQTMLSDNPGTARNWRTVEKLLDIAQKLEAN